MKAKYAIKDLLRIHAVRKQTRKMFASLLLLTTKKKEQRRVD